MTLARLLDVSRLVSRAGLAPTGVDRVELAYLRHFIQDDVAVYGLARTALGYVLLDQAGLAQFAQMIAVQHWGRADLMSRFNRRLAAPAKRGQTAVRKLAVARARRGKLAKMLSQQMPDGFAYYNTGHSNLSDATLRAINAAGGQIAVLIHDTIPLDWPDMQRDGTVAAFASKLRCATRWADKIICSTHAAAADLQRHIDAPPAITIAPLGVDVPTPQGDVPQGLPQGPYFLALGTIEPRKNHTLLLDIWADWPAAPPLVIVGRRGWKNADVFARLDRGVPGVIERNDISDADLPHWLARATALVLPSFAEGFGLPPAEALALGTPVIVADLPACREVLGAHAVYADPTDRYQWQEAINAMANGPRSARQDRYVPPDWDEHFNHVLTPGW